ncbi:MAG: HEAT repeat domain-containing protein, partial [Ilumatobacteraceae bacterium]
ATGANARWREVAVAGHCGDDATARAALVDADPVVRELALGALNRLHLLDDLVVTAALADPDPRVRRRAATLAANRPGIPLLNALSDDDSTVVETAAWACGEQQPEGPGIDDAILHRLIELAGGATDALIREAAVAALGAIGDERALPAIIVACQDKPAVRRRAILALSPFDDPTVDAALRIALTDRDWQVRQAAEDVTRAIDGGRSAD